MITENMNYLLAIILHILIQDRTCKNPSPEIKLTN